MRKIKLLNSNMINKIAAGEVVERPSSVVKELVENSIDSDCGIITLEVNSSLIRVSDNGDGILSEDVENVFLSHATSKIENIGDLENIKTLGFRGEAMASIAAVSQVELITRHKSEEMGTRIVVEGGIILKKQKIGAAKGTSVIVRNLFYNVPVRLKFLKKPSTEFSHITDLIDKFALGNPNITFNYILNGKKQNFNSGSLKTSIYQIYGKQYYNDLLEVYHNDGIIEAIGYIAKPTSCRFNRGFSNFFINGRYIKSDLLQRSVEEAYKTKLPIGKFPVYVIKLNLDPVLVDVNVHPTKLEVRFQNEEIVYNLIYKMVDKTLKENELIPAPSLTKQMKDEKLPFIIKTTPKEVLSYEENNKSNKNKFVLGEANFFSNSNENIKNRSGFADKNTSQANEELKTSELNDTEFNLINQKLNPRTINNNLLLQHQIDNLSEDFNNKQNGADVLKNYTIIGLFFNTYWALQQEGAIYLIDQHAAHERVLYEKFSCHDDNNRPVSQVLLKPVAINLNPKETIVFNENLSYFIQLGFEIETLGQRSIAIRAVPFIFGNGIVATSFLEILDGIDNHKEPVFNKEKFARLACKAAVKGGDRLKIEEAKALINSLMEMENPFTCPHGRPTIIKITKYEIEKMFKRIQ